MKKFIHIFLSGAAIMYILLPLGSCTKKIDESYWNPNAPVRVPIETILPGVQAGMVIFHSANGSFYGVQRDNQLLRPLGRSGCGILLETGEGLDVGTKLDLRFSLPTDIHAVRAVGQVVREAPPLGDHARSGVEFLILLGQARDRIAWFVERSGEA